MARIYRNATISGINLHEREVDVVVRDCGMVEIEGMREAYPLHKIKSIRDYKTDDVNL